MPPMILSKSIRTRERVPVQMPCARDDLYYNMSHIKMGRCVILNFKDFNPGNGLNSRQGTDLDATALEKTFGCLGFEVSTYHNLTVRQTILALNEESQRDYSNYNCFVLCFLSHGEDGGKCSSCESIQNFVNN